MLGTLYVGTTLVGWGLYGLSTVAMASKLKREGYGFVKNNKSQAEKMAENWLETAVDEKYRFFSFGDSMIII